MFDTGFPVKPTSSFPVSQASSDPLFTTSTYVSESNPQGFLSSFHMCAHVYCVWCMYVSVLVHTSMSMHVKSAARHQASFSNTRVSLSQGLSPNRNSPFCLGWLESKILEFVYLHTHSAEISSYDIWPFIRFLATELKSSCLKVKYLTIQTFQAYYYIFLTITISYFGIKPSN